MRRAAWLAFSLLLVAGGAEACSFTLNGEPEAPGRFWILDHEGAVVADVAVEGRFLDADCSLMNPHAVGDGRFAWLEPVPDDRSRVALHVLDVAKGETETVDLGEMDTYDVRDTHLVFSGDGLYVARYHAELRKTMVERVGPSGLVPVSFPRSGEWHASGEGHAFLVDHSSTPYRLTMVEVATRDIVLDAIPITDLGVEEDAYLVTGGKDWLVFSGRAEAVAVRPSGTGLHGVPVAHDPAVAGDLVIGERDYSQGEPRGILLANAATGTSSLLEGSTRFLGAASADYVVVGAYGNADADPTFIHHATAPPPTSTAMPGGHTTSSAGTTTSAAGATTAGDDANSPAPPVVLALLGLLGAARRRRS